MNSKVQSNAKYSALCKTYKQLFTYKILEKSRVDLCRDYDNDPLPFKPAYVQVLTPRSMQWKFHFYYYSYVTLMFHITQVTFIVSAEQG